MVIVTTVRRRFLGARKISSDETTHLTGNNIENMRQHDNIKRPLLCLTKIDELHITMLPRRPVHVVFLSFLMDTLKRGFI